jgi:hypothetical protein
MMNRKSVSFIGCSLGESMNLERKIAIRRLLSVVGVLITTILAACGSVTPIPTQTASLRLEGGAVQVQDGANGWVPVGGETTFELVGEVESTDPWMVTGNTFARRDTTQLAEGLEVGDLVRVKGVLLEDGTWLANSIEPAEDQIDPAITLIGKVDSVDPWVVHGITLEVTEETEVSGEIVPGMIVDVDILLREDGTWEVLSITPLSDFTEIPGCATVTATVVSVEGQQVQFAGWPTIELPGNIKIEDEFGQAVMLRPHQMVLVVVCATEDGQFTITKLIVLKASAEGDTANGEKVLVCHKPDKKGGHTLSVAAPAVPAHLAHGDKLGACP